MKQTRGQIKDKRKCTTFYAAKVWEHIPPSVSCSNSLIGWASPCLSSPLPHLQMSVSIMYPPAVSLSSCGWFDSSVLEDGDNVQTPESSTRRLFSSNLNYISQLCEEEEWRRRRRTFFCEFQTKFASFSVFWIWCNFSPPNKRETSACLYNNGKTNDTLTTKYHPLLHTDWLLV